MIIFYLILLTVRSQVIPEDRRVDWALAKSHFTFEEPALVFNIMDFGGSNDGTSDNSLALQEAVAASGNLPAVIYFPAGIYLFNSPVHITKDSLLLKGAGSGNTLLKFDFQGENSSCISFSGVALSGFMKIKSGYIFKSRKLCTDSAFMVDADDMIEIREENGDWDTRPADWAKNVVGQMVMVDSVIADTLFLRSPLFIQYDSALHPQFRVIRPIVNSGISCLKIQRLDEPTSGGGYNILFSLAKNGWVSGVESDTSVASHVYITQSLNVKVSGCYFHHAFRYDGAATHGYGVTISNHASECLVENNIFKHLRHAMMVKAGACGNVFGYNYSTDVYRSEFPHSYGGDISLHGHYPFANLFEGNIVENIILDHYWGPSGPLNTFFRNRATRWGLIFTNSNLLESVRQNVVGNEITNGDVLMGQYNLSGNDHFEYGNNVLGETVPAGTDSLPDFSYYLDAGPDFWDVDDDWPSIGLPNFLGGGSIPAEKRFENGSSLTVCGDSTVTYQEDNRPHKLNVFPNPNNGWLMVRCPFEHSSVKIMLWSLHGEKVLDTVMNDRSKTINLKLPEYLPSGIYLLKLGCDKITQTVKIYVQRTDR